MTTGAGEPALVVGVLVPAGDGVEVDPACAGVVSADAATADPAGVEPDELFVGVGGT
ncbi:MAG: hypothetical protein ABJE66_18760 [Deltaproteobacteria bacterium]